MCGHIGSVLNSVIGNRYYASLVKGGKPALGVEKRAGAKGAGGSVARFWPSFFPGLLSKAFRRGAKIGERF